MINKYSKKKRLDILFIDDGFSNLKIKGVNYKVINLKEKNFYLLFQSLFTFIFKYQYLTLKEEYLKKILEFYKPRVVIGHNFNHWIYEIKKIYPKTVSIVYLHNRLYLDQISFLKKKYYKKIVDYYFVCDELHKKRLSKSINSKFIINGLTRNNEVNVKKVNTKRYDLMIISEFRNLPKDHYYTKCFILIVRKIAKYAKKKNLKVLVALNSSRKEKTKIARLQEISFFKKIYPKFYFNYKNSYQNAELSKLSICIASNLGADLLARGKKVLFLPFLEKYSNKYKSMYLKTPSQYICKKNSEKEIFKKLDGMLKLKKIQWEKILIKSKDKFIFDKQNKIIKKLISNIINNVN
tara:strand:+ start:938 stop:1990 length:1053 start_codon:yes stop_codon:yes gene_type:complete